MSGSRNRLLLHACCGPCTIHPLEKMCADYNVSIYYYNPNIHPEAEYVRRLSAARQYCLEKGVRFVVGPYIVEQYFRAVAQDEAKPNRCAHCYSLRLSATASAAQELGFDAFTSTLLVSPYQDRDLVLAAGERAAEKCGAPFLGEDFRDGYRDAMQASRDLTMYRQKYCGCRYSEAEGARARPR